MNSVIFFISFPLYLFINVFNLLQIRVNSAKQDSNNIFADNTFYSKELPYFSVLRDDNELMIMTNMHSQQPCTRGLM